MSKKEELVKTRLTEAFAERLRELMLEEKESARSLSKKLNLNVSALYKWLGAVNLPSLENAILLADEFCCSLDYLFCQADDEYEYIRHTMHDDFGDVFVNLLAQKGISEYRFVQQSHISRSKVSAWRKKTSMPCIENLIIASQILDVSLDTLVGRY